MSAPCQWDKLYIPLIPFKTQTDLIDRAPVIRAMQDVEFPSIFISRRFTHEAHYAGTASRLKKLICFAVATMPSKAPWPIFLKPFRQNSLRFMDQPRLDMRKSGLAYRTAHICPKLRHFIFSQRTPCQRDEQTGNRGISRASVGQPRRPGRA